MPTLKGHGFFLGFVWKSIHTNTPPWAPTTAGEEAEEEMTVGAEGGSGSVGMGMGTGGGTNEQISGDGDGLGWQGF